MTNTYDAAAPGLARGPMTEMAMPPKEVLGSCNYWQLSQRIIENLQITLSRKDPTIPMPTEPHWFIDGQVAQVINEGDGDIHIWLDYLNPDGSVSKGRFAAEITPQQKLTVPAVGAKVRVLGILRYDHQHGWWELHPVDAIHPAEGKP